MAGGRTNGNNMRKDAAVAIGKLEKHPDPGADQGAGTRSAAPPPLPSPG